MDRIVVAQKHEVKMMIFSLESEKIRQTLLHEEDCGLSVLHGESGYMNNPISVIVSVVPYEKVSSCKEAILKTDPRAFIVLENVQAAYSGNYKLRRPEDTIKTILSPCFLHADVKIWLNEVCMKEVIC